MLARGRINSGVSDEQRSVACQVEYGARTLLAPGAGRCMTAVQIVRIKPS